MRKTLLFYVFGILGLIPLLAVAQSESDYPRDIIGWGQCNLKVVQVEFVEELKTLEGTLTAGRLDAHLALIKVQGKAPKSGYLSVAPNSFGAQFLYRGMNKLEISKAWGIRGKNLDTGKLVDNWASNPEYKANLGVRASDDVNMWFAVVVPKNVKKFYVVIPSLIEAETAPGR
jgi:hypothetical protein